MFNQGNIISFAIYVSILFLPHIIPIVLLCSVNPDQCTGWFFIFQFFTCIFILYRFTHVITAEISSRISTLLEKILKLKIKEYTFLIYDTKRDTYWTRKGDNNFTANLMPSVIGQQFRCHAGMIQHLRKRFWQIGTMLDRARSWRHRVMTRRQDR